MHRHRFCPQERRELMTTTKKLPRVLPVIHHIEPSITLDEIQVAIDCAADGVFLISHESYDDELVEVAKQAIQEFTGFPIGLNLLSLDCWQATRKAVDIGCRMVWADDMGVDSSGLDILGRKVSDLAQANPDLQLFASVAFKYRPHEREPVMAAHQARLAGFIPTTSGEATGSAPDPAKIASMGAGGPLAVASGMTPQNVLRYSNHLSHILVATGVSRDEYHIDPAKLRSLIEAVSRTDLTNGT